MSTTNLSNILLQQKSKIETYSFQLFHYASNGKYMQIVKTFWRYYWISSYWYHLIRRNTKTKRFFLFWYLHTDCMDLYYDHLPGIYFQTHFLLNYSFPQLSINFFCYTLFILGWFLFKREVWCWWYWARILNEHEMRFAFAFINLIFDILRITFWGMHWGEINDFPIS